MRGAHGSDPLRIALAVAGVAAIAFGLWPMRDFDTAQLFSAVLWLGGVVLAHDFVLAPVVVGLGLVVSRWLQARWRTPLVVAFVLWGAMTLVALPAMSGLGERTANPSLLDRPYVLAWWVFSLSMAAGVLAYGLLRRWVRR